MRKENFLFCKKDEKKFNINMKEVKFKNHLKCMNFFFWTTTYNRYVLYLEDMLSHLSIVFFIFLLIWKKYDIYMSAWEIFRYIYFIIKFFSADGSITIGYGPWAKPHIPWYRKTID